jgi:hypothetical protein
MRDEQTESAKCFVSSLHNAADALVPLVDDRRHATQTDVGKAHTRRARAMSHIVSAWLEADVDDFIRDPNVEAPNG